MIDVLLSRRPTHLPETGDSLVSEPDARGVKAQLDTHEAVCALRYAGINARLKRLETILLTVSGAIILLLIKLVIKVP